MTPRPTVLFVRVHTAGRSLMAAGRLHHLAGDRITVWPGGASKRSSTTSHPPDPARLCAGCWYRVGRPEGSSLAVQPLTL
jgi:hypothetical protein